MAAYRLDCDYAFYDFNLCTQHAKMVVKRRTGGEVMAEDLAEQGNHPDRLAVLCRWMVRGRGVHRRVGQGALTRPTGRSPRPMVR